MLQYQNHQEGISDLLGPYALALTSSEFLVGAALGVSLTLAYPPNTLTIFALQVCIQQTIQLSRTPKDKVVEIKGPKKIVYSVGPKSGFAAKDFMEKARKAGEVVFDGTKQGGKNGRDSDGGWVLKEMGRLVSRRTRLAFIAPLVGIRELTIVPALVPDPATTAQRRRYPTDDPSRDQDFDALSIRSHRRGRLQPCRPGRQG